MSASGRSCSVATRLRRGSRRSCVPRGPRRARARGAGGDRSDVARPGLRTALCRVVGGSRTRGGAVKVLHLQKVAGISGSEAHLLSLLPRLREHGWDARLLMLHEDEPGAFDFARALTARGVPMDAIRLRADVDPAAFLRLVGYLVRHRPEILHTH